MSEISQLEAAAIQELADRKHMALKVFRPLPHQDTVFEMPRPKFMLVSGGNRAGKTLTLAVLLAAVMTDTPVVLSNGKKVDLRMPWQKGKPLRVWIICIDWTHVGETIHPMLFKPGSFKVCIDPETKKLRSYKPDEDEPKGITPKESPALIPSRFGPDENFAWNDKKKKQFSNVQITDPKTGDVLAEVTVYTSMGNPPQGKAVDLIFIDEQLERADFINEMVMRTADRRGGIVWASWNREDSDELAQFNQMLDREIENKSGLAKRVMLALSDNAYLGSRTIEETLAGCSTEAERLARDRGIAPSERLRMYPLFNTDIHKAIIDGPEEDDVSRAIRANGDMPPKEWTRVLTLDPGSSHPAVLLCAVPPPEMGEYYIPYQEFCPENTDAIQLAKMIKDNTRGQVFYRFIMDDQAGRKTPEGFSMRVRDAYINAFRQAGLKCTSTGHHFLKGSNDVGGRQMVLQSLMHIGKLGLPKLRIITGNCPNLCKQLKKVKKKMIQKEVVEERKARGQYDLVDCLEYYAASKPSFVVVNNTTEEVSDAYKRFLKRLEKKEGRETIQIGTHY